MSSLIVEVCEIKELRSHANPEVHSLEIAIVKGWQCIVKKGQYKVGDRVVFFPPDSVLPTDVSDRLGVTAYLHKGRVKSIRLKGEPSYGLVVTPDNPKWEVGRDVAKDYGATKYEPPPPELMGRTGKKEAKFTDTELDHPLFWKYTDMENLRHFPDAFIEGEEVVMTEKLHGTSVRIGMIRDHDVYKIEEYTDKKAKLMVGSKNHRRKQPMKFIPAPKSTGRFAGVKNFFKWLIRAKVQVPDTESMEKSWFWFPATNNKIIKMLTSLSNGYDGDKIRHQVELFGEVYGSVQSLHYGVPNGLAFSAFDLIIDGHYVDYDRFVSICSAFGVEMVPLIYRGPFSLAKAKEVSEGQTLMTTEKQMREGVVIKPVKERHDHKIGRVILKYVGDEYLQAKEPDKKGNIKITDFAEQ